MEDPLASIKHAPDDPDPPTALGAFMRRRNVELGLSVAAVAQRVGMSRATWYRIAKGECASPGVHVLRGLARVYRVPASELFALATDTAAATPARADPLLRPEAGDALWRCRHATRVAPGDWFEVQLALRNLSGGAWVGAQVRALYDRWLTPHVLPSPTGHVPEHGLEPQACLVSLPATAPWQWARTQFRLRAPRTSGEHVFCLALHTAPALPSSGAAVALRVRIADGSAVMGTRYPRESV